jgi:hypothetical protein
MAKKKLSVAEEFYLQAHREQSPAQLAKVLGLDGRTVAAFLRKLPPVELRREPAQAEAPTRPGRMDQTKFAVDRGVVSYTTAQSRTDDEDAAGRKAGGEEFLARRRSCIHQIHPEKS